MYTLVCLNFCFSSTPLFHPCQNPPPWTLYNAHKYCKISLSGGLAQLVEQRTLKILLREWIDRVGLPSNTSRQSFLFSKFHLAHLSTPSVKTFDGYLIR